MATDPCPWGGTGGWPSCQEARCRAQGRRAGLGRGGAEGSPGEVVPLLLRVWLLLLFAGYTEGLKGTNCHSSDSSEPRRKSSSRRRRNFDLNVFITMAWPTLRERVACGRH